MPSLRFRMIASRGSTVSGINAVLKESQGKERKGHCTKLMLVNYNSITNRKHICFEINLKY